MKSATKLALERILRDSNKKQILAGNAALLFGDDLTCDMLWRKQENGFTSIHNIIVAGQLDQALTLLTAKGERLTKDNWLQVNSESSVSPFVLAIQHKQLEAVFKPEHWVNRVREMQELWKQVPLIHQAQMDGKDGRPSFRRNLQMANSLSARSLGGGAGGGRHL